MLVIASCATLFAVAVIVVARWSAVDLRPPSVARADENFGGALPRQGRSVVTRPLWYGYLVVVAGAIAGVLGAGAGGRLIMRVLALTSPPSADGQITETQEVIGEISVNGTIALFIFGGALTGVLAAALYVGSIAGFRRLASARLRLAR